ncbi:MAG: hypothetical protein WCK89_12695 [bacterium]|nr:hypothetical protein [Candidatus Sumerlaeota bacterium]
MKTTSKTDALLVVITVCLILITLRVYNIGVLPAAQAQFPQATSGSSNQPIPVAIYGKSPSGGWYPVKLNYSDYLRVEIAK